MKKFLPLLLLMFVFVSSFASAEVAVITQQNETSVEYKIDNGWWEWLPDWLGGGTVAIFTKDYSYNSLTKGYAGGHGEFFESHQLIDDINFYDRMGENVNNKISDVKFSYAQAENVTYEVPQYEEVCEEVASNSTNGTTYTSCYANLTGYIDEVREEWNFKEYNGEEIIGKFQWKLEATYPKGEDVDWVLTVFGQELLKWDWWDSNWEFKKELTNLNGSISALYTINTTDISGESFSSIRFLDYATESVELDYDIAFQNATHVGVRLNNYGSDKAYMYYGNDVATDQSNASAVYLNPVAGYYFDTGATDFAGSNDGTNNGATPNVAGKINTAYDFEQSESDYITIANDASLNPNYITISMWIKPESFALNAGWLGKASSNPIYLLGESGGGGFVFHTTTSVSGYNNIDIGATLTTGAWHHIVMTYNGTDKIVYVNGTETARLSGYTGTLISDTTPLNIGRDTSNAFYADGLIDEVYIYDRALNTTEIAQLYNQTQPAFALGAEEIDGARVTLINPADAYTTNNSLVDFSCNATFDTNIANLSLMINGEVNYTNTTAGTTITLDRSVNLADGDYNWTCQATTVSEITTSAANRTLGVDTTLPAISISSPLTAYDFLYNNQTLNLNWSINDTNLDSCWYVYNGISNNLTCNDNTTTFQYVAGVNNVTMYANDTFGNQNILNRAWIPKVAEVSQSYNNETVEGRNEDFSATFLLADGTEIQEARLFYNGFSLSPTITSSLNSRVLLLDDYQIPNVVNDTNVTFYWGLTLNDLTQINSTSGLQLIQAVNLDNCSAYTYELLNISLYDEKAKTGLSGDLEIEYTALNKPNYETINDLYLSLDSVQNSLVCSSINLSNANLAYSLQIKYSATGYESELYNIQQSDITGDPVSINLYDINSSQSTTFKVIYQDDTFSFVEGAIVQLMRKYISEGIYQVVEAPLTSKDGVAIVHVDLDSNIYKANVVKDGEVLDVIDNIVFSCESELTGECTQNLLGEITPTATPSVDTLNDLVYSITDFNEEDESLELTYSIPSGTPSSVNLLVRQIDQFGNETTCNKTIISSGGSTQCTFDRTIGDTYLHILISKDGKLVGQSAYKVEEDSGVDFLGNNYIIVVILVLSLVGLTLTSPEWTVLISVVSLFLAGGLWLINGTDFVMGLGMLMWLFIAAIIIIVKLSKQEDR